MQPILNELICGDNIKILKAFESNCIDLTVTSPPYDGLRDYNGYSFDFEGVAKELYRVTKEGGIVVWVVGDSVIKGSESGTSFRQALYFKEIGFRLHDTMIYQKETLSFPANNRYQQCFEYMFVFSKGKPNTFNPIIDHVNCVDTHKGGKIRKEKQKDGTMKEMIRPEPRKMSNRWNIWRIQNGYLRNTKDKIAYKHPAIFPESLAHDHIISWSNEGDVILDPFAGSGTTCKMAKQLNRNYIGIDVSQEYIDITKERLN